MELTNLDWGIIIAFFIVSLGIGIYSSKRAGKSAQEFFLSGRNMPWWLLGVSMVATTFAADTPGLVTQLVRQDGVAGNWVWWVMLLTGMLTVFVYTRLWRRSGLFTDLEFYDLRYGGKEGSSLRIFRAVYLGLVFNVLVMTAVCLAGIKIGQIMLGLTPVQTILIASVITVVYSSFGGLRGVILTDFFQFFIALIGAIWSMSFILDLPEVGGLSNLLTHENVVSKINLLPDFSDNKQLITLLIIPFAVQWWSQWYPGAEPGGGGYIAQRMLSAKNENHAVAATFFFNIAHYALRPWPWIIVALASLIIFPDLQSIQTAFPAVDAEYVKDDLAYSAMLTYLPAGLVGLVVASLIAAFMSTISTHLNWGASYMVNDFWIKAVEPDATEKKKVTMGRVFTVIIMALGAVIALYMESAKQIFDYIIMLGAGTGLVYILRWFWWRINIWSEISAMVLSFLVALYFKFNAGNIKTSDFWISAENDWLVLPISVLITTVGWIVVTFATQPTSKAVLSKFYEKTKPLGRSWKNVVSAEAYEKTKHSNPESLAKQMLGVILGCFCVYGVLLGTGKMIYGFTGIGLLLLGVAAGCGAGLWKMFVRR